MEAVEEELKSKFVHLPVHVQSKLAPLIETLVGQLDFLRKAQHVQLHLTRRDCLREADAPVDKPAEPEDADGLSKQVHEQLELIYAFADKLPDVALDEIALCLGVDQRAVAEWFAGRSKSVHSFCNRLAKKYGHGTSGSAATNRATSRQGADADTPEDDALAPHHGTADAAGRSAARFDRLQDRARATQDVLSCLDLSDPEKPQFQTHEEALAMHRAGANTPAFVQRYVLEASCNTSPLQLMGIDQMHALKTLGAWMLAAAREDSAHCLRTLVALWHLPLSKPILEHVPTLELEGSPIVKSKSGRPQNMLRLLGHLERNHKDPDVRRGAHALLMHWADKVPGILKGWCNQTRPPAGARSAAGAAEEAARAQQTFPKDRRMKAPEGILLGDVSGGGQEVAAVAAAAPARPPGSGVRMGVIRKPPAKNELLSASDVRKRKKQLALRQAMQAKRARAAAQAATLAAPATPGAELQAASADAVQPIQRTHSTGDGEPAAELDDQMPAAAWTASIAATDRPTDGPSPGVGTQVKTEEQDDSRFGPDSPGDAHCAVAAVPPSPRVHVESAAAAHISSHGPGANAADAQPAAGALTAGGLPRASCIPASDTVAANAGSGLCATPGLGPGLGAAEGGPVGALYKQGVADGLGGAVECPEGPAADATAQSTPGMPEGYKVGQGVNSGGPVKTEAPSAPPDGDGDDVGVIDLDSGSEENDGSGEAVQPAAAPGASAAASRQAGAQLDGVPASQGAVQSSPPVAPPALDLPDTANLLASLLQAMKKVPSAAAAMAAPASTATDNAVAGAGAKIPVSADQLGASTDRGASSSKAALGASGLANLISLTLSAAGQSGPKQPVWPRETAAHSYASALSATLHTAHVDLSRGRRNKNAHPEVLEALRRGVDEGEKLDKERARWLAEQERNLQETWAAVQAQEPEVPWRPPDPYRNLTDNMVTIRSGWAAESREVAVQKERDHLTPARPNQDAPTLATVPHEVAAAEPPAGPAAAQIPFWEQEDEDDEEAKAVAAVNLKRKRAQHPKGLADAWTNGLRFLPGRHGLPVEGAPQAHPQETPSIPVDVGPPLPQCLPGHGTQNAVEGTAQFAAHSPFPGPPAHVPLQYSSAGQVPGARMNAEMGHAAMGRPEMKYAEMGHPEVGRAEMGQVEMLPVGYMPDTGAGQRQANMGMASGASGFTGTPAMYHTLAPSLVPPGAAPVQSFQDAYGVYGQQVQMPVVAGAPGLQGGYGMGGVGVMAQPMQPMAMDGQRIVGFEGDGMQVHHTFMDGGMGGHVHVDGLVAGGQPAHVYGRVDMAGAGSQKRARHYM